MARETEGPDAARRGVYLAGWLAGWLGGVPLLILSWWSDTGRWVVSGVLGPHSTLSFSLWLVWLDVDAGKGTRLLPCLNATFSWCWVGVAHVRRGDGSQAWKRTVTTPRGDGCIYGGALVSQGGRGKNGPTAVDDDRLAAHVMQTPGLAWQPSYLLPSCKQSSEEGVVLSCTRTKQTLTAT